MNKEVVAKIVKAVAAVLACVGVVVSPEQQQEIISGFFAVYAIVSGVQGKIKADKK